MKKIFFLATAMTAMLATSCSNEDNANENKSGYSAIELGGVSNKPITRAGFTGAETTLKVHYVSTRKEYNATTFPYNDGEGKSTLYMTSTATAAIDGTNNETSVSAVSQTPAQMRYWDDLHGKNSILSLYAIAVPNKTSVTKNASAFAAWDTNVKEGQETAIPHTIAWQVSTTQTSATIADEDLAYSNNLQGDGHTLGFIPSTSKFEKAENAKTLDFKHALSRITINVNKGNGFGDFATEFKVTKVLLASPTTAGNLDVTNGTMTSTGTTDVEVVGTKSVYKNSSDEQIGYTYLAQIFPGKTIFEDDNTFLTIVVDGNNYYIKGSEIYAALLSNNPGIAEDLKTLKQGVNYQLFVNIKKTSIEIMSAKLVDWDKIDAAALTPSNAIALSADMEQSAGTQTTIASDLYRSTSLATGYTASGNKTTLAADNTMGDIWYWPNNTTNYYFRTISPQGTTVNAGTTDKITMTGGAIVPANDFIWGATLKEKHSGASHTFTYSNGYDTYLHDAIGVTSTEIHITQFHMMSNIEVDLATTETGDKVDLSDATVEILNFYNTATLALSNANITTTGAKVANQAMTTADHLKHTWRVVPQSTTGITFKITAEGNIYIVNLPADTGIATWVPGKSYVYKFTLKKTGILITSAKLADWIEVKAANKDITLES